MPSPEEKPRWPRFIRERFGRPKDLPAKDLDEFLEIVAKKQPAQINITVVEKAITTDGSPASVGAIDHYEFTTLFSFSLGSEGLSVARYREDYPESKLLENNDSPDLGELNEMKIRAIITAMNRTKRINSRFPLIQTQLSLADAEKKLPISDLLLDFIQREAQRLKLSPFII